MAKKELVFETGKGGNSSGVTVTDEGLGMRVYVSGVEAEDIVGFVTPEEIAEEAELGELLKAIIAKHGLNQLLYELMDSSETTAILDIVYDADDDITRTWAIDKFASESE